MPLIQTLADCIVFSSASGSDTLQGAINAAQSAAIPLFIAGGTYTTTPLTISSSLTMWSAKGAVTIRSSNSNALQITIAASSGTIYDVKLEGIIFDGESKPLNSGASGLLNVSQGDRIVIEDCFIYRSAAAGLYLNGTRARVYSNLFNTCQTSVFSTNGFGMLIDSNVIYNSLNNGIYVDREPAGASSLGYDGSTISRNVISQTTNQSGGSGQFGNGIFCYELQYTRIVDNLVAGASYAGIRVNFCTDVVISGNQLAAILETGILVENPALLAPGWSNIVISNNSINDYGCGIAVVNTEAGARRAVITGNTLYNGKQNSFTEYTTPDTNPNSAYTRITNGVGIFTTADCNVDANVIEQTAGPGIALLPGGTYNPSNQSNPDNNTIGTNASRNIVKYCQIGIGFNDYDPRGYAEISNNIIIGSQSAQIIRVQVTNLAGVPGIPNNQFGPLATVSGSTDQGTTNNDISNRFSFTRNKIVPATTS